jgi:hypothetical protein
MDRSAALRYLARPTRLGTDLANRLLDEAAEHGTATDPDGRATVTFKDGAWEVHRPGFGHPRGSYYYLSDLHPVDCTECGCPHFLWDGRPHMSVGDPYETCTCGHLTFKHCFRKVSDTLDVCKDPSRYGSAP